MDEVTRCAVCGGAACWRAFYTLLVHTRDGRQYPLQVDGQLAVCERCAPQTPMPWLTTRNKNIITQALRETIYRKPEWPATIANWRPLDYAPRTQRIART